MTPSRPLVHLESEHQELFALDADLSRPVAIHIPSALGTLGYYVCLRVADGLAAGLAAVQVHLQVGGLRPDDVRLAWGDGIACARQMPSREPGQVWVLLCRANLSRGDGTVTFANLPAGLSRAHVLLCTWPRFIASGQADDWVACQRDPQWAANGIPLGGIGCGKVELGRDGRFRNFSGNNNQDMPFEEPDGLEGAYLEVSCGAASRVLATRSANGVEAVPVLEADLAFPQAILRAPEALPGLDVCVTAAGSFVPQDLALACLPGLLVRWLVHNRTDQTRAVCCRLAWPNLVGQGGGIGRPETRIGYADGFYRFWEAPREQTAEVLRPAGLTVLRYGNAGSPESPAADGCHLLAVGGAGTSATPDPRRGSVCRWVEIPAGGEARVDMALVWAMPQALDSLGVNRGLYWQNHHADGVELVTALLAHADRILEEGAALRQLLAQTDLPEWLWRRLCNSCYPLITNSVLYRDGRFSINEGPTEMAGCCGTLDQRVGSHPATQLLYPQLNRQELGQFADRQAPNGGLLHDFGGGHLERPAGEIAWPDLTCSFVLQTARHAWSTGDTAFEHDMWPHARRAILRHREWAEAGKGVAQVGKGLGTSYDGYHYHGTTPYMGTLWIAALLVARRWATQAGDRAFLELTAGWVAEAQARMDADLWNGEYYRAFGSPGGPVNDNCHAGMLAGEYYARALAGDDVLPVERLQTCADALLRLNGHPRFAVPPDEVSADLAQFTEFGWLPYVECFAMAPLAILGRSEMLAVWKRIVQAMNDEGRRPCDTRLMYQPVSGLPSWGSYYMTAPASWLVYEALLDFAFLPGEGVLRLCPQLEGRMAVVHPRFWAIGQRTGLRIDLTVVRVWGASDLTVQSLEALSDGPDVQFAGQRLAATATAGRYTRYALPSPWLLQPGATLAWSL